MYVSMDWYVYCLCVLFFLFQQKTAYEMRISDWSSDVCSSDLAADSLAVAEPQIASRCIEVERAAHHVVRRCVGRPLPRADAADEEVVHAHRVCRGRSDERRVGKAGVSSCRSRWSLYH